MTQVMCPTTITASSRGACMSVAQQELLLSVLIHQTVIKLLKSPLLAFGVLEQHLSISHQRTTQVLRL